MHVSEGDSVARLAPAVSVKEVLFYITVTWALMIAAAWQAFQGDWFPAIFFAILWAGHTNNVSTIIGNRAAMWRWKVDKGYYD